MSFELFSQISLIFSGLGLLTLISKKIPQLLKISPRKTSTDNPIRKLVRKIKDINPLKKISFELFLQKTIARIRILTLKTDNKTINWLQKLREKTQNKLKEGTNYWEELKKIKK